MFPQQVQYPVRGSFWENLYSGDIHRPECSSGSRATGLFLTASMLPALPALHDRDAEAKFG